MDERNYYLAFSLAKGIGPKTFNSLLKYFKTAKKAWNATSNELKSSKILGEKTLASFEKSRNEIDVKNYLEKLKQKKASFLALCDKNYPKLLKEIPNPPIVLFVKGDISKIDFNKTIGVVGTRRITNYGRDITRLFSSGLAQSDFTIVSGLAMGVDAEAANSAIEAKARTIAVMGNGVDLCFPSTNEKLYDKIIDGNGIIVSEYPLGLSPNKGTFPSRNRIIAGLSMGVLVTEGAEDSGSLITADYAFKFNRKVFAIPGPITSSFSVGPLKLIEKGAKLVTSAEDIIKELGISHFAKASRDKKNYGGLNSEERRIIELLENESLHFDEIVRKMSMNSAELASLLSILEIKNLVKSLEGGFYKIVTQL